MRKYGLPLLILFVSSFLLEIIRQYVYVSFKAGFLTVILAILLFAFGASLNDHRKTRGDTWLKKMIFMFIFVIFVLLQMRVVHFDFIDIAFSTIGFTDVIYQMMYIYLGYVFFS